MIRKIDRNILDLNVESNVFLQTYIRLDDIWVDTPINLYI